jgi:L-lactate dehydrogenase complex protein LldG
MPESSFDPIDAFRGALDDAGVTHERVHPGQATAALERAVEEPAVGVPIDVADDVELPAGVATDFAPTDLQAARTGVTPARLGVAETGSLLVRSTSEGDELVSLYPEHHVAVVRASDVVANVPAATSWLADEVDAGRDSYVFATGASATADMGALVEGVHGPTHVHVVVVDPDRDTEASDADASDADVSDVEGSDADGIDTDASDEGGTGS